MAKWTDYTIDTNPTDTDEVMTLDADKSPKANKRVTLSTLADYFLDKLASNVFAKLETQNKTVIGALNELNSNQHKPVIFRLNADSEKELCQKIADVIMENPGNNIFTVYYRSSFIVGVNVYYSTTEYFIYTVVTFDTSNRYICEYYQGKITVK